MSIAITCCCGKKFKVEDELANQQVQCQCGNVFTVPKKPHIPWKKYYALGWGHLKNKSRLFAGLNPKLLKEELICYWGFLIAKEAENIGLEYFSEIETVYLHWKKAQVELLGEQNLKKFHQLAKDTYRLSKEIGEYCWGKGYRFHKFSDIARVEDPLVFLDASDKIRKMADLFWRRASRALPWVLRFSTLFNTTVMLSLVLMAYLLWNVLPYHIFVIAAGAAPVYIVFLSIFRIRQLYAEKKRLQQVWIDCLAQTGEDFISPEIVQKWIEALFEKRWKDWKYIPAPEIIIPDDLTAGFIPDVMFPSDTIAEFGIEFDQEAEGWSQSLYRFCRDSFRNQGEINLCFFYSENQPRIGKFLQRVYQVMGEQNETKGEELIWLGQHNCSTPRRMGTFLSLLSPLFQKEIFPIDKHWEKGCELFDFIVVSMQIYDYYHISSESKSQLKKPIFLEIFAGLRSALYMLAQRRPLILVIENLDHSDLLSLDFICNLTQEDRNHRLCFLVSYNRESVLHMPALKETILLLQKHNCWKTPEKQLEEHVLSKCFIGKTNLWQSMEDGFNRCTGTPVLQMMGIEGSSGLGKTFLGRQFLQICSQQEGRQWTIYCDHSTSSWQRLNSLTFLLKLLEICQEKCDELPKQLSERVSLLYDFLHFDFKQNTKKHRSFCCKKDEEKNLYKLLDDFDHSGLSENDIVEKRRYNLQREIADVLSRLACQKTMVLFLDNLHNADSSSLELLYYLLSEPPEAPIFIIFSWDSAAVSRNNVNFHNFIEGIRESQCYQPLKLGLPNADDVANYIAQEWKPNLLAESANSPFVRQIMELTGGNTLLIIECLKLLLSSGSLYQFGGFWILKEESLPVSLELEKMARKFIESFPQEDHKLLIALLRKASIYGEIAPIEYLEYGIQDMGWTPEDTQAAVEKMLAKNTLLKPALQRGCFEFVHSQYQQALYRSLPTEQKKEMHQQVFQYIENSCPNEFSLLLTHAEAAKCWDKVLEYSQDVGYHNLKIMELCTANAIFDRGILAAQHLEEIPSLAKYYLFKSLTFPSKKLCSNMDVFKSLLAKKDWKTAVEMTLAFPDPAKACEEFLAVIQGLDIEREDFTVLARQQLDIFKRVRSEYQRYKFMGNLIHLFSKTDPLQLRSLVEHSLKVVKDIYNINLQSELYLLLQEQLGEMDLDLIRIVSNRISPVRCSTEKSKSICYLASFLPKNPDMMGELLEEAKEVANRVYRIMAYRSIAQHLLSCALQQVPYIFDQTIQFIGEISAHSRRMEALDAFLTGKYEDIKQENFAKLIASFADDYRLQTIRSLLNIIQKTLDVPLRLLCLKKLATSLSLVAQAEGYKEFLEEFIEEFKKLKKASERGEGLLEIANAILEDNMNLAHQYLEEGLGEIEKIHSPGAILSQAPKAEKLLAILQKVLALLQKFPQPVVYPLWDRTIKIAEKMESEKQDPLYSDMVISLFPYDQEKAMQVATQIHMIQYRHQTIERLLALPKKILSIEALEKAILEYSRESYGHVLLQQMAEKDSGRARCLLRELPDTLETKIASMRLCKTSGQRIRAILKLSQGTFSAEEILSQISVSLEMLLKRKEYDPVGNEMLLETIPDGHRGKITLLISLVYATQEVDPALACNTLVRFFALLEKHRIEAEKDDPELREILTTVEEMFQQLQPSFIETYIEKILPGVEVISDKPMRNLFIKNLCEKLKSISPDIVLEILEKTADCQLRSQLIQSIDKDIANLQHSLPSKLLEYLESLTALGMIAPVYPSLGQPVRQIIGESIASCGDEMRRIKLWTQTLDASGNWDKEFNDFVFSRILQEAARIPQEVTPYIDLLHVLQGLPRPIKNRYLSQLIDYMINTSHATTSLCAGRDSFWNALRFLDALIPFGSSHMHGFVMKLLTIPKSNANFPQTIEYINEFLFLCRGMAPEKECEWIAEAINYLDTASHKSENAVLQEDYYLLRALNMLHLGRSLVVYQPAKALQAAQRALQLTEYSVHRQRLHRYILLLLSSLIDVVQAKVKEKAPELFRPIEIMRFQWAYHHLQALKEHELEEHKKFLQEEKNIAKELLHYLLNYLNGTTSTPDKGEMEDLWSMAYQQFEKEIGECFDKLSSAKEGPRLVQAFFVLAQALCLMDDESLSSWRRVPWFQRLVRMAGRMDAARLHEAGDDLLQPDEKEEFALLVQRVSLVYPKSVLYLIRSMFSTEKISEISATLEEEAISDELLKEIIEPLKNISLSHYRDRLLGELVLEWAEYNWKDGFLLVTSIADFEMQAATIYRLLRKSCDFYPNNVLNIVQKALSILQKIQSCPHKIAALEEIALRVIEEDYAHALSSISMIESREKQQATLQKIIAKLDLEQSFFFVPQIVDPYLRAGCLLDILYKFPDNVESRCAYLGKFWDLTQQIQEDDLRIDLMKQIARVGIREKELSERPQETANILLAMWENAGVMNNKQAFLIITSTFPNFIRLLDKTETRELFQVLYRAEYLPIPTSHGLYKTMIL